MFVSVAESVCPASVFNSTIISQETYVNDDDDDDDDDSDEDDDVTLLFVVLYLLLYGD